METLKFCLVTTHFPPYKMGGDAIFVGYLADELARRGHEVHVVYSPSVYSILRGDLKGGTEADAKLPVTRHEYRPMSGRMSLFLNLALGTDLRSKSWAKSEIARIRPDVVHWHNTKGFVSTPFSVEGARSLYTAHDYYSVCPRSNLLRPGERICEEPRLCQACLMRWAKPPQLWRIGKGRVIDFPQETKILCPSEYMADRLRKSGVPVHSVLRGFVPDPGRAASDGVEKKDTILFVGILERRKGPQTLLRAFIESRERHDFRLVMVGEGPLKETLKAEVAASGAGDRVSMPGFISRNELESLLRQASLMAVPSEWPENAPSTALEAFSFGVPVLGTSLGGLPEMLTPDSGSIIVGPSDPGAIGEKLVSLWNDRKDLQRRGLMARKTYEERFSPEAHISAYMRIIGTK